MITTYKSKLGTLCLLIFLLSCGAFLSSCGGDDSPSAPENPVILDTNISGFSFSWNDTGNPIQIQVSENESFSVIAFDSIYESSPSEVIGLKSGTNYFVRGQHANSGNAPFTESVSVTTNDLLPPTGIAVSEIFGDSFTLRWPAIAGATYSIDVSLENTFDNLLEGYDALAIEDNEVEVVVPQTETTYYFRLKSVNGAQSSAYSEVGTATTDDRLIFKFMSSAFTNGGKIPGKYSCGSPSPPISWRNPPEGTVSLALIMVDLDFAQGYNHWVVFDIPTTVNMFSEGASGNSIAGIEGRNGLGNFGYFGPCPPAGQSHRYVFTLYALDKRLGLGQNTNEAALLSAMSGHIIGQKTLTGIYF